MKWVRKGYCSRSISTCLATVGVCVFQCANFGWRTFYFYGEGEKTKIAKLGNLYLS